jgi:hypothetical protein
MPKSVAFAGSGCTAIARHRLVPSTQSGVRQLIKSHHPTDDPRERELLLRQRFGELGPPPVHCRGGTEVSSSLLGFAATDIILTRPRARRFTSPRRFF